MATKPNDLQNAISYYKSNNHIDELEKLIEEKLTDLRWASMKRSGEDDAIGFFWSFVVLGYFSEDDIVVVIQRYLDAGWGQVEIIKLPDPDVRPVLTYGETRPDLESKSLTESTYQVILFTKSQTAKV